MTIDSRTELEALTLSGSGPVGVLAVHGFTGSPASMRPLARAVHAATGAPTFVPRLPGHGTSLDDMESSTWDEWVGEVQDTANVLRESCDALVVFGLSMGGALSLKTAVLRDDIAHVGLINPAVFVDSPFAPFAAFASKFMRRTSGISNAINKPGEDEMAYSQVPLRSVGELYRGLSDLRSELGNVTAPVTYFLSGQDDVVAPRSWNFVRQHVRGGMRTVPLPLSNHVATLDYDRDKIENTLTAIVKDQQETHSV